MWALVLLSLVAQLSPPAHVRLVRDNVATVTSLTAVHRGGQTFLAGTKNAGSTGATTYAIRRSASPITSSSDGTLINTLDANSYRLRYTDDPGTVTKFNGDVRNGVLLSFHDLDFTGTSDAYTGGAYTDSWHVARFDTAADLYKTCTEDRLVRYVKMVRDNLTGDGVDFQIDSNRVYGYGASLGSGLMDVIAHHPEVFAAGATSIGFFNDTARGSGIPNPTKKVNSVSGPTIRQYLDMGYAAAAGRVRPLYYAFASHDAQVSPAPYTAGLATLETYRQPFYGEWKDADHNEYAPTPDQWNPNQGGGYLRFKLNEAYPAFGSASTSTAIPTFPGTGAGFVGQRNGTIDWQSSLHTFSGGAAIVDTVSALSFSLKSSTQATGVTVTGCNAQAFLPSVGEVLLWSTDNGQSGSATRNSDGTPSAANVTIPTSPMQLTFAVQGPTISTTARIVIQHE